MHLKKLMALLLAVVMLLSLCACGAKEETKETEPAVETPAADVPATDAPTEPEAEAPAGTAYTVKLVDEGGNPIVGTLIQVCQGELCLMPSATDAEGVATFYITEEGAYEAKLLARPEGYDYTTEEHGFPFGNAFEVTITLKAIA